MIDNHGRTVDYVRLAVTDRCNLRCHYCMPERFTNFLPKNALLTFEELERLLHVLSTLGVRKLRLTGGEPFVRSEFINFIERIAAHGWFNELHLTTNGVLTAPLIPRLKAAGIAGVNLSLDTLDRERFNLITRRDEFDKVMHTFHALLEHTIPVRINTVVMEGINIDDLVLMTELTRNHSVEVRFIEEMPFNGSGESKPLVWDYQRILHHLSETYSLMPIDADLNGTAMRYSISGHKGNIGVIAAYSRTFCGSCNRLRISPKGELKTCLYGTDQGSVFSALRTGQTDKVIAGIITQAVSRRHVDGFGAEREMLIHEPHRSMVTIGG